jgi:hypothetical protein
LAICVGIDRPASFSVVNGGQLAGWSRTLGEALVPALENLRAISPSRFERQESGFYISDYGDWHDSARLLLPHLFEQLALRGQPVAVPLARHCVVVAGSDDPVGLEAMAAFVVAEIDKETRPTAYLPIVLQEGVWRTVDSAMQLPDAIHRLCATQRLWDYGAQLIELERRFQAERRDVFVAPLESLPRGGRVGTWSTWTFEVATLLPRADALVLNRTIRGPALVRSWDDVQAICGHWRAEPYDHPPRYLVEKAPTPQQLAALEATEAPAWFLSV